MKPNRLTGILFCFLVSLPSAVPAFASAALRVVNPRCEYAVNPVGIGTARPRLSWRIESTERGVMQSAYEIRAAKTPEALKSASSCKWTTGRARSDQSIHVEYGGPALKSGERVYWSVRIWDNGGRRSGWSAPAFWEAGLLAPSDWKADWIAACVKEDTFSNPCPMLRREFAVNGPVRSARLYMTCLGLYQAEINGKPVTDVLFAPGWTAYNKRLQVQAVDVTSLLKPGRNAAGVMLGDGWYRGYMTWTKRNRIYGDSLELLFQMHIRYADGKEEWVVSDDAWKSSNRGPVRVSSMYNGETYDARMEMPGWSSPGFDDGRWEKVAVTGRGKDLLTAQTGPPVKRMEEIRPVRIFKAPNGDTVVDMGQNMVGWLRVKARGPAGTGIILRHAEALDKDGNAYFENLRSALQTNRYILKGSGTETFEPHFSFQGFRYATVSGFPGEPALDAFTGIVVYSDIPKTGWFACSNPLINKLQENIWWGQKGNFLDVPTDCPQRDERLGWTGDAQAFARTACFNADVAAFYSKWLQDLEADQKEDGAVPHVVPDILSLNKTNRSAASAGWADAAVIVPWTVYLCYGDKRILERQYASMKAWVDYVRRRAGEKWIWNNDFTFGDWLMFHSDRSDYTGASTDKDLIATAYFARSADLLSRAAGVLGRAGDAALYRDVCEKIRSAFQNEFVTGGGRLSSNTQTAYALALAFGLLPENKRQEAAFRLAGDVRSFGHLTTGFLGTPLLCPVLARFGHADLAYMLLNRTEYPSWLYPVTRGATTIWERWDGVRPDGAFQDKGMNSLNHYAYGAIGEWLYSYVAGIELDEADPGYRHIILQPHPGGGLTWANARLFTQYGPVVSEWTIADGRMAYTAEVPPNTKATLFPPGGDIRKMTVDGKPLEKAGTVRTSRYLDQDVIELGSGRTVFSWPYDVKD
jgi:alpha-L-rhamnosidase